MVVAGVAVLSYRLGSKQSRQELAAMQEKMDRLEEAGKDAAIVKRVSQQMEDIAYQQKTISDRQRDRAEEQTRERKTRDPGGQRRRHRVVRVVRQHDPVDDDMDGVAAVRHHQRQCDFQHLADSAVAEKLFHKIPDRGC